MMYAVYRNCGFDESNRLQLLFVTASKQVAEDSVALAALENEEHYDIYMRYYKDEISSSECYELQKSVLTVDPEGSGNDISYEYEEVEVR